MSVHDVANVKLFLSLNILQAISFYKAESVMIWLRDFLLEYNEVK